MQTLNPNISSSQYCQIYLGMKLNMHQVRRNKANWVGSGSFKFSLPEHITVPSCISKTLI